MWLVTKNPHKQEIYDQLWGSFGALYLGPEQYLFMSLEGVESEGRYEIPLDLLEQLKKLHRDYGMCFYLSSSAAWSYWLSRNSKSTFQETQAINYFSKEKFLRELSGTRLYALRDFFSESLSNVQGQNKWDSYLSFLGDKGFKTPLEILESPDHQECLIKYGFWWRRLTGLLTATTDFQLDPFVPILNLREELIFREKDFVSHVFQIFQRWEKRLKTRRAVVSGVQLIFSDSSKNKKEVNLHFDESLQESYSMFQLFYKKWMQLKKWQNIDMNYKWVDIRSFELQPQESIQLSLLSEGEYSLPDNLVQDEKEFIEEFRRDHVA